MSTTLDDNVLRSESINVAYLTAHADLVGTLRTANDSYGSQGAPCWFLFSEVNSRSVDECAALTVGVRGSMGALLWQDEEAWLPDDGDVPANGLNADYVDYFSGGRHHNPMPPHTELPVEQVLEAVTEFARTGERPTCVEWVRRAA